MNVRMNDVRGQKLKEIEEFLQANPKNNFWVYGAAQYAELITGFLQAKTKINIAGYVVDDAYYNKPEFLGKPVHKASVWINGGGYLVTGAI